MTNNDILRKIRYAFDLRDQQVIKIFKLAEKEVTREEISCWLKKDTDPDFKNIHDKAFATFLDGFISYKRGKREGPQPIPEKRLTNNIVLKKLKIALNLKDVDMVEIILLADLNISKHEINNFFRNPSHSKFVLCKDQILRRFLEGMQYKYRGKQS